MVTVIIPTYKRADYLIRAINSVLNQNYKDFEIIVVDDNNPDTEDRKLLEEKMKQFANNEKVIYIQHEKNKNGAAARNTGIRIAKGDYITFLDDDDYFLSDRLMKMVNAMDNNPEYGAAYSGALFINNGKILGTIDANRSGVFQKELLMQKSFFMTGSNLFFRAEVLKELNGFDERFLRHQDMEVMIRFFNNYKILGVNELLVVKDNEDRKNVPNVEKTLKIKDLFFETFKNEISRCSEAEQNDIYYYNYREVYILCIRGKLFKEAKNILSIMKKYKKVSYKERIMFIWTFINVYVPISKIKRSHINQKYYKSLDEKIINEIKMNL